MRIGGGIGGGDAARRLPSFSAAPTLSSPRSVINLASEILNLAPPAYRFFLSQVTLSNLPLYGKSLYLQLCTRDEPGYYYDLNLRALVWQSRSKNPPQHGFSRCGVHDDFGEKRWTPDFGELLLMPF